MCLFLCESHRSPAHHSTQLHERRFVCFWRGSPQWTIASSFTTILDHIQRRTTVSRTPLEGWSVRRRDLYLTTYTKLTTDKRPCPRWDSNPNLRRRAAADGAATGTGITMVHKSKISEATHHQTSRSTQYSYLFSRCVVTMSVWRNPRPTLLPPDDEWINMKYWW